jgi:hypothetical protein
MNEILNTIELIDLEIERQDKLIQESVRKLSEIKRTLQKMCSHTETKYVPDASGNNDSYYYCLNCGLEKKRFN